MLNYEASELRKLAPSDMYRIKITGESGGETRWLSVNRHTFDLIAKALVDQGRPLDFDRARKLDETVRKVGKSTPVEFDRHREDAPVGSELWHGFMGDVLAAAHNKRVITMDRRNELLQELYVVWTGDESE